MAQVKFNYPQFDELLKRMFFEQLGDYNYKSIFSNRGKAKSIGYDDYDPCREELTTDVSDKTELKINTLKYAVINNLEVKELLKSRQLAPQQINFKTLYNKLNKFEKNSNTPSLEQRINKDLVDVCFKYIDIVDVKDLDEPINFEEQNVTKPKAPKIPTNNLITREYLGLYYSYKGNCIKEFRAKISCSVDSKLFTISEVGFHENRNNKDDEFTGEANINDNRLKILLTSKKDNAIYFNLYIPSLWEKAEALRGSLTTLSSFAGHVPMCVEVVLVQKQNNLHITHRAAVDRYLFLHRYNFIIRTEEMKLSGLKARGKDVDFLSSRLNGQYRIWRFDENSNIIQSRFDIKDNYKSTCYTAHHETDQYNEQVCLIFPNKSDVLGGNILGISTHPKISTGIISYLMLDIKERNPKFITGGLIYIGNEEKVIKKTVILEFVPEPTIVEPTTIPKKVYSTYSKSSKEGEILKKLIEKEIEDYISKDIIDLIKD